MTFVAPSARSYLFHFILSTNKSKTSATKRWDFTFWTCLSNRLPSDFVLPKGYNESMLNSDSQFLSVICVMLESKTEGEKKVRNGLLLSDLQPWGHQWKWSWSRVVQSSPPPPPPPSRPPSPPLLPPIFFFFFFTLCYSIWVILQLCVQAGKYVLFSSEHMERSTQTFTFQYKWPHSGTMLHLKWRSCS